KSAFLANMSHEIRTPLGIMLGFTDLIVDPKTSQEDREHFANVLKKNGEQLSVIINDILDLSKVEAGELRIELQNFSLQSVVEDVFSSFEVKAKEKKIRLTANFSNETGRHIMSDKVRVKQIIWNLIGNAIKFTDSGEINLHCSRNGNFITVEVRDTGIGIPTEFQGSLFKPFSQVDQSNTRKYGGTGLGLALSKKLARNLGGDLVLKESSPGKGSIFKLTLEDRETHEFTDQKSEEKTEASSNAPTPEKGDEKLLEKCNVLLVEDSEDNQNLISLILGRRGARITIAKNGAEGVEKAMSDDYDLVLMDLQMPVMDGYTATQTLRERGYNKPIIALTAHAMQDVRDKCIEAGCTDHLVKPINFAELIKTVRLYGTLQNHH
ncbi:MAG: response regulator, partial [Pseudobdellovibrio sp.]